MMQQPVIERHVTAGPEIADKLKRSRQAAEGIPMRAIRCPLCGFYLLDAYGSGHYLIRIKCRKCKFDEVIDTALFRTMRQRSQQRLRAERRRRYGQGAALAVHRKHGANALLKGMDLMEGATTLERNQQIGGYRA